MSQRIATMKEYPVQKITERHITVQKYTTFIRDDAS